MAVDGTYEELELQQIDDATYEDLAKTKKEKDLMKLLQSDTRRFKRVAVGVGLLCAVLALLNVAVPLALYQSNMAWRDQWNNTLTEERDKCQTSFDQLMTRYNQLTEEKEQIQTNFNQLTEEKEQLQTSFDQLENRHNSLTVQKEQLQTSFSQLTKQKEQLQTSFDQLENRHNSLTVQKEQLQTSFSQLTKQKEQLQTSFDQLENRHNSLTVQKEQLQTSFNQLTKQKEQLQTSFDLLENRHNSLTVQKEQLQNRFDQLQIRHTEQKDELQTSVDQLKTCRKQTECARCEPGWQKFGRGCYYISTGTKTWDQSRQWCRERQSDLIVIKSQEKQDFVASFNKRVWLGLTDRGREGSFQWIDGTPLTTPTYWYPGEPHVETDETPNAEEDCVEYYDGTEPGFPDRGWNDVPCSTSFAWICERAVC